MKCRNRNRNDFMNNMHEMNHMHRRPNMGIFSIIPFAFDMVFSCVNLAFRIVEMVLGTVFGILSGRPRNYNTRPMDDFKIPPRPNTNMYDSDSVPRPETPRQEASQNAKAEPQPKVINLDEERAKQKAKAKQQNSTAAHDNKNNWYIVIFLFTLIASITALCMGMLLEAGLVFSGGLVLIGLFALISKAGKKTIKEKPVKEKPVKEEPCKDEEIEKLLKAAEVKIQNIRVNKANVPKYEMQQKLEELCQSSDKIIKIVRANPDDFNLVRKFFYYYLDSLNEITAKYIKIVNSGISSEEINVVIKETEKGYDEFKDIFKEYQEKLLERDLLNLKAEINVIKNES